MAISKNREDKRFYKIWADIKTRCNNPKSKAYKNYGMRGIKICNSWNKYDNFKQDMWESYLEHVQQFGEKQTTIDRIDVDKNYEPDNCRWANYKEQRINIRNKSVYCGYNLLNDKEYIFNNCSDFAIEHGLKRQAIVECVYGRQKTHKGWTFKRIS